MDTSKAVTHIGLCAGYGGIELGLKRAIPDLRTVALCEIEAFAVANLVAKMEAGLMDPAPVWPNLKTFPWEAFRDRVDILTGGYPCQPFSAAGQRKGKQDPRHLWPWIADGIRLLRPRICFFENVEGHISLGLSDVIEDLAGMGYRTTWGIFSASEVGAPHQRKRVFILALASGLGGAAGLSGPFPRHEGQSGESDDGGYQVMADSECSRSSTGRIDARCQKVSQSEHCSAWPSRPGQPQHGWEPPRVVGNTESKRSAALGAEHEGLGWELRAPSASSQGVVGDTVQPRPSPERPSHREQNGPCESSDELGNADCRRQSPSVVAGGRSEKVGRGQGDVEPTNLGQAQPTLGGDAHGPPGGLGYAELCRSCDNRTDELRLLGNGVVPATAERAFRVLIKELP
jgi:site-specific DNA-cytosine methylase